MKAITANELKTKGVASIDAALAEQEEAIISVRGKERYVVMDMETYNRLRVCELEAALYQAQRGYNRRAARFLKKHPDLLPQYEKALKLLEINPFHPSLRCAG